MAIDGLEGDVLHQENELLVLRQMSQPTEKCLEVTHNA